MNISKIRIISWFGRDYNTRSKRREYHKKQVDYFIAKGFDLVIYAQEYEQSDFIQDSRIRYIVNEGELKLPGAARNILLDDFYSTDEDWCIFADNDSIIRSVGDEDLILTEYIYNYIADMNMVAIFLGNPLFDAYNVILSDKKYSTEYRFMKSAKLTTNMFAFKNIAKHNNIRVYFNQELFTDPNGGIIMGEDYDFAINLLKNNLGVYKTLNSYAKELGFSTSTYTNKEDRKVKYEVMRELQLRLYNLDTRIVKIKGKMKKSICWLKYINEISPDILHKVIVPKN